MGRAISADYANGNPYSELYIYYLSGRVPAAAERNLLNFLGNWEEEGFSFLFFSRPEKEQVSKLLDEWPGLILLDSFHMRYHEWQGAAAAALKISGFHVIPPWLAASTGDPESEGGMPIILDPGVVFGTGTHATTKDCLEAVQTAVRGGACHTVLDLGTGTGLLALAAIRSGCERSLAVDLNPLAASTALTNVRLNHMEDRILVIRGRAEEFIDSSADLLIANIHYDIMQRLIRSAGFLTKKRFILSGLMRSEAKAVRDWLCRAPVDILQEWSSDGIWHTFLGAAA